MCVYNMGNPATTATEGASAPTNGVENNSQPTERTYPLIKFEYVSDEGIRQLLTSPFVIDKHKNELRALKKRREGPNCYRIEYDFGKKAAVGEGRLYAGKASMQGISAREVQHRQYLCGRQYHDIDQVNSAPTLYLHLLRQHKLVSPELEDFVTNRKECLERWQLQKDDFLAILNCDKIQTNIEDVKAIHAVLHGKLYPILAAEKPDMAKRVKALREVDKKQNPKSSLLCMVLHTLENTTMLAMHDFFIAEGWYPDILIFDGIQVRRKTPEGPMPDEVLRKCEEFVKKQTGVTIRLAEKSLDVPRSFLKRYGVTIPDKWQPAVEHQFTISLEDDDPNVITVQNCPENLNLNELRKIEAWRKFDFRRIYSPSNKNAAEWFLEVRGSAIMKHSSGYMFILGEDNRWRMEGNVLDSDINLQVANVLIAEFDRLMQDVDDHGQEENHRALRKLYEYFRFLLEKNSFSCDVAKNIARNTRVDNNCLNLFLSHPELFAFEDGVYELFTGEFRPFKPTDYILHTCGYKYPGKDNINQEIRDHILDFFEGIFPTKAAFTYRFSILARCCYGRIIEEIYIVQKGGGRNGKGTETVIEANAFGNYFQAISSENFTHYNSTGDAPNSQLFSCFGKRLVSTSESKKGDKFNSKLIKGITGLDPFPVRDLHGKTISFPFTGLLHIQTNEDIQFDKMDNPLAKRTRVQHYPFQFVENAPKHVAQSETEREELAKQRVEGDQELKELDTSLKGKFYSPEYRDQFILMLLDYFTGVIAPNQLRITTPDEVMEFTQKNVMNSLTHTEWLTTHYDLTQNALDKVKRSEVWTTYQATVAADKQGKQKDLFAELGTILALRWYRGNLMYEGIKRKV